MAKIIQRVSIKRTKNELRSEQELQALEQQLNTDPIIMDLGKYAPIQWLTDLYHKKAKDKGLDFGSWTEEKVRRYLFHTYTKHKPITLFSIKYLSASAVVLEKEAREILDDAITRELKRKQGKRLVKIKNQRKQRKQN